MYLCRGRSGHFCILHSFKVRMCLIGQIRPKSTISIALVINGVLWYEDKASHCWIYQHFIHKVKLCSFRNPNIFFPSHLLSQFAKLNCYKEQICSSVGYCYPILKGQVTTTPFCIRHRSLQANNLCSYQKKYTNLRNEVCIICSIIW